MFFRSICSLFAVFILSYGKVLTFAILEFMADLKELFEKEDTHCDLCFGFIVKPAFIKSIGHKIKINASERKIMINFAT